jgi:hypothetical protein
LVCKNAAITVSKYAVKTQAIEVAMEIDHMWVKSSLSTKLCHHTSLFGRTIGDESRIASPLLIPTLFYFITIHTKPNQSCRSINKANGVLTK